VADGAGLSLLEADFRLGGGAQKRQLGVQFK